MALAIGAAATLQGCGTTPLEKPRNFKESEILTMAIATEVVNQADILQTSRKITPSDTRDLIKQTDAIRDSVVVARGFIADCPAAPAAAASQAAAPPCPGLTTATEKINLALKGIQGLRDYLIRRGGTFTPKASG